MARVRLPQGVSVWHLPLDELWPLDEAEAVVIMCRGCGRALPVTARLAARLCASVKSGRRTTLVEAFKQSEPYLKCSTCGARRTALLTTLATGAARAAAKRRRPDTFLMDSDLPSWEDSAFYTEDEDEEQEIPESGHYDVDRDEWVEPGDEDEEIDDTEWDNEDEGEDEP